MANEAILMWETEIAIPVNVADENALPKGSALILADGFIGSISTGVDETFLGFTKIEKIANDGNVKIAVFFGGIWKVVVGTNGATKGHQAVLDDAVNTFTDTDAADIDEGLTAGKFLESGTVGETVLMFQGKF